MSAKAERLHLRVDAEQKALLEAASQAAGASVSTFVLKAATDAAADVLADRRVFLLDEDAWRVFDEVGVRAVLIHCETDAARDFYLRPAEFESSPTDPMHLLLLMQGSPPRPGRVRGRPHRVTVRI
jgi:hypothetical protein